MRMVSDPQIIKEAFICFQGEINRLQENSDIVNFSTALNSALPIIQKIHAQITSLEIQRENGHFVFMVFEDDE